MKWVKTSSKKSSNPTCPLCRQNIFEFHDPLRKRILNKWEKKQRQRLIYMPLYSFPSRFEDDDEALLPLCIRNPLLFKKASARLKDDVEFVNTLIKNVNFPKEETDVIFKECSLTIRNNKEIASTVISDTWKSASFIGEDLQKDRDSYGEDYQENVVFKVYKIVFCLQFFFRKSHKRQTNDSSLYILHVQNLLCINT